MRKFESLMHLKDMGLNVGELNEFEYSEKAEMFKYARHLFKKFGGLIIRTDFPKHVTGKVPLNLPFISPCKEFRQFEEFVEAHKEKYTYILFEMCDYSKAILSAYVYLDELGRMHAEINDVDKINMRDAMKVTGHLKTLVIGPGAGYDDRLNKVRFQLIKAKIPPDKVVELSVFDVNGVPTPVYKQFREGF